MKTKLITALIICIPFCALFFPANKDLSNIDVHIIPSQLIVTISKDEPHPDMKITHKSIWVMDFTPEQFQDVLRLSRDKYKIQTELDGQSFRLIKEYTEYLRNPPE